MSDRPPFHVKHAVGRLSRRRRSSGPRPAGPPTVPPDPGGGGGPSSEPRLDVAEAYVALLADTGISHGLIGPREAHACGTDTC